MCPHRQRCGRDWIPGPIWSDYLQGNKLCTLKIRKIVGVRRPNQPRTPPFQRPAIADWRKEITLTWGRIQYPAMSAFEGASMPYSDQVKENSESMGKEGKKMVKESEFGRHGQKIGSFTSCHRGLHRNRLSVLPLPPPGSTSVHTIHYNFMLPNLPHVTS